jgi:hypothetical protein
VDTSQTSTSHRQLPLGLVIVVAALMNVGCAGVKFATPLSIEALRKGPVIADVGYTNANGVPSLAERVQERPGLKMAIVQVAYAVQGRPELTFITDVRQFGNVTTWKATTTPEVRVPASFAVAAALHATKAVEKALAEKGFGVIAHDKVAATAAHKKYYGQNPVGYTFTDGMLGGFSVVGAPPMGVKKADGLISFGQLNLVWPDATALTAIKADLGEDTLLLNLRIQSSTMQGSSGMLKVHASLSVNDPDFVGYGVGGFGHAVTSLDAHTDKSGTPVPGFVKVEGKQWTVQWTPVFQDLGRVHTAFAKGWAAELAKMAHPPAA